MSGLGAGQSGSEPPAPSGRPDKADEGPPVEGLPCAEPGYEGPRSEEIRALIRECLEAEEGAE